MVKKKKDKPKVGRPTKYLPSYARIAFNLCLLGATNEDIARTLEVDITTFYLWQQKHDEFSHALKEGREKADSNVARRLYERATGYEMKASKIVLDKGEWKTKEYIERFAPDPVAAIFWLKNRRPDQWRDKMHVKQSVITVKCEDDEDI